MKAITVILIFISTLGFSQIPTNMLDNTSECILQVINEIRIENGLEAVEIDTCLNNASEHHIKYTMVYYPAVKKAYSHSEVETDSSHLIESIPDFRDRAIRYGARSHGTVWNGICENVVIRKVFYNSYENAKKGALMSDPVPPIEYVDKAYTARIKLYESIKSGNIDARAAAEYIVYAWMKSPGHKAALLQKGAHYIGAFQKLYVGSVGIIYVAVVYMCTFY